MTKPLGTTATSGSGGSMVLVAHHGTSRDVPPLPSLDVLAAGYKCDLASTVPAGTAPFLAPGTPVAWHFGRSIDVARVVSDDERGLVAWLPTGAPRLTWARRTPGALRDLPLSERFLVTEREWRLGEWRGPGVLRVAPTGKPWSLWWFWDTDGTFGGVYVNLELPHRRVPSSPETHSRDLTLDLWIDADGCWMKDADELAASVEAGQGTAEQADCIRAIGDHAAAVLMDSTAWPFTEGFEDFRPTEELDAVPALPDVPLAREGLAAVAAR